MLDEVAVVERAQAEILELPIAGRVDGVVELASIVSNELGDPYVRDVEPMRKSDRLRKRLNLLAAHLLVDRGAEQACGELRVLVLVDNQRCGRLDRKLIELARRCAVV